MSQAAQAQAIHERAVQSIEEAKALLVSLADKVETEELSAEAYKAEEQKVYALMDKARGEKKRAAALAQLTKDSEDLASMPTPLDEPDRPMYRAEDAIAPPLDRLEAADMSGGHLGMSPCQLARVSQMAGVDAPQFSVLTGRPRQLLNRHLLSQVPQRVRPAGVQPLSREELSGLNPYVDPDGAWMTGQLIVNEVMTHLRDIRHIRSKARVIVTDQSSVAMFGRRVKANLKKTRHRGKLNKKPPINLRDVLNKTSFVPSGEMEIIKVPEDLLRDTNFDFIGWITREMAEDVMESDELLFLTGTGAQEPWGILEIPNLGGLEASGGGAAIAPEDVRQLKYQMRAVRRERAVWLVPSEFMSVVTAMRDESNTPGKGTFLFQQALSAGDPDMLAGKEVMETEFFPDHFTSGSQGDPLALLADLSSYVIVENGNMQTRILDQLYAEDRAVGVQYTRRMDAAPIEAEAFVTLKRGA